MAIPTTRSTFKDYCLRRLGSPVIDINVDEEQTQDRIDDALAKFRDYHYDGSERVLISHEVTQTDKDNGYITLEEDVVGVTRVMDIGDAINASNLFNIRYQIHLNDLFDFSSIVFHVAISYITFPSALVGIHGAIFYKLQQQFMRRWEQDWRSWWQVAPKMRHYSAKLGQDGAKTAQDKACLAILKPYGESS